MLTPDLPIYVAGHRGMVGSALVRALQAAGLNRLLLRTQSGAPGQWHANVCSCPAPPPQVAAYPTP